MRLVPHPSEHEDATRPLDFDEAEALAESMRAFATGSRLRLLWALLDGELTVEQLAEQADLSQSAASHQLRLLRQGRLVRVRRSGRHAYYGLHDHHMVDLLAALRHHHEHVNPPAPMPLPDGATARAARSR
ncbi:metalloregulator ArsR/SmtB family transcription factor [Conexibacter sp. JD483]|uniref:ArsR/SmtB family transcription factor n=1 Tax=unclassified Conexibacter TaxID=2627773 RepID=UPI002728D657|nr:MULTISPECIES: metalloregulator ArsR/SmtB family transcription factor [unclassified Conexibacter]MDO8188131.1 metalloregulator ArsR/SmtB family transcription factor [Conexibacter sp. CPCC 205706]MDO8201305.1 metalloregulator ArsR/SmtB family transcription factor [Conexibacter sp. CPCC 205762]MDR9370424.1 metalloregulator ArsR/SmtB family transcription factor [Conexibacter sp. JD483]